MLARQASAEIGRRKPELRQESSEDKLASGQSNLAETVRRDRGLVRDIVKVGMPRSSFPQPLLEYHPGQLRGTSNECERGIFVDPVWPKDVRDLVDRLSPRPAGSPRPVRSLCPVIIILL